MKRLPGFKGILFLLICVVLFSLLVGGCNDEKIRVMFDEYEKAGGRLEEIKTAAILDFLGKNPGNGEDITRLVADRINRMGYIQVMESSESRRILRELGLPTEGVVSPEDARQICEALKVDALISGTADAAFNTRVQYRTESVPTYYYRDGKRHRRYRTVYRDPYLNRNGNVTLNIHIYDSRIHRDLGTIELKRSYNKNYDIYYRHRVRAEDYYYFDRLHNSPMPTDLDMIMLICDRLMDMFVEGFTPYYVDRIRQLAPGVPGLDQARDGKWDEAREIWDKSFSGTILDANLYQNLGIYYERKVNAARAYHYYQKGLEVTPGNETLQEYSKSAVRAREAQLASDPVDVTSEEIRFHVAEVKPDGTVYINGGIQEGIREGDRFLILRARTEFYKDLVTPRGTRFYQLGEFTAEKVFDGICQGRVAGLTPGMTPRFRDPVVLVEKAPPTVKIPQGFSLDDPGHLNTDNQEDKEEPDESGHSPSSPGEDPPEDDKDENEDRE